MFGRQEYCWRLGQEASQASTLAAVLKLAAGRRPIGRFVRRAALSSRMASLMDMQLTRLI